MAELSPARLGADDPTHAPLRAVAGSAEALSAAPVRLKQPLLTPRLLTRLWQGLDGMAAGFMVLAGCASAYGTVLAAPFGTVLPFVLMALITVWTLVSGSLHDAGSRRAIADHVLQAATVSGVAILAVCTAALFLVGKTAAHPLLATGLELWVVLLALHAYMRTLMNRLGRAGRLSENVIIVGATDTARRMIEANARTRELNIAGVFDDRLSRAPIELSGVPVLGRIDDLLNWDKLPAIQSIIVTVTPDARERSRALIDRLRILPQRVAILLDYEGLSPENRSLAEIAHSPAAYVSGQPGNSGRAVVKRLSDIGFALLMAIVFSPILLAVAIAIRLDSPGPIFFRQRRHGFNNQIIRVWKFRSMQEDKAAETRMSAQTSENDPRVTRVGRFIRATSLDELPQLLNVLKGEMSIVGPRPHAIGMTADATDVHAIVADYAHRHRVKPGITGWAQIHGSRGPVHTKAEVRDRIRLDLEYVNQSTFWLDLYIMLMTAPCLLGDRRRSR